MPPIEPPPTRWAFGSAARAIGDIAGVGADLEPGTVLAAYRHGLFPMEVGPGLLGWWSPESRGIIPLGGLRVSRSLRRSVARFEVRVDTAFTAVVRACASVPRPNGWINEDVVRGYTELHRLGWAHSVEAWSRATGGLAGGLYGVAIGGLFAGESMFHVERDASKVALVALVDLLGGARGEGEGRLLDCQWRTPHLASLGCVEVERGEYLRRLTQALALPLPGALGG